MTVFTSKWLTWEPPETSKGGTDKTAKWASVSFVSSHSTHSQGNEAALGEPANEGHTTQDADSPSSDPNCANGPIGPIATPHKQPNRPTPETSRVRSAKSAKRWDAETAALIEWFLRTKPPSGPLQLQRAVYIAHPDRYWKYLRQDIAAGPNRARGRTGAFQENLWQLYRVLHDGKDIGGGTP